MSEFVADKEAPVYSHEEVVIAASPEAVWDLISEIDEWPRWNPDIKKARLEGQLSAGTSFTWKAGPGTIHSILRAVDRPHVLGWTGKTMGIPAIHVYRLAQADGQTHVVVEESWNGFLSRLFRKPLQKTLDKAVHGGLWAVKTEAEARSAR